MGEKGLLIEVAENARKDLKMAQTAADATPRPANACPAHDCQFALTKAQTHGIDVLLMLKLEEMRDSQEERDAEDVLPTKQKLGAMIATALVANMKTLIITVGLVVALLGSFIIFTRQIKEAAGFVTTSAQAANGGSNK
jgi:hypothetical protein